MAKFSVSYARKVQTLPYENITVNLTAEFDDEDTPHDHAFNTVRNKVELWLKNELDSMGLSK